MFKLIYFLFHVLRQGVAFDIINLWISMVNSELFVLLRRRSGVNFKLFERSK